jgi:POT family proton-dependent oligopeptide transporter
MRNVLTQFLVSSTLLYGTMAGISVAEREGAAKEVFHTFVIGVYFFPLLGGWVADRLLGKYRTILYLSLVYCLGHGFLALFDKQRVGFFAGLFLIALGAGGIKPCVSAFVGDQFDQTNKHRAKVVFDAFYWIINFGSLFASLFIPVLLRRWGPAWAFGVPGVLMLIATILLWAGRGSYVHVPPAPPDPDSLLQVAKTALLSPGKEGRRPGLALAGLGGLAAIGFLVLGVVDFWQSINRGEPLLGATPSWCLALVVTLVCAGVGTWWQLDRAHQNHPPAAVEGTRAVLKVLVFFALVTPFWSLFDQKASTWVLQATRMTRPTWFEPSQMQALNPLLIMLLIPFNNMVLFPRLRAAGLEPTALRRMTAGIAISGLSWIVVGLFQIGMDAGHSLSIVWQILPYMLLSLGEVLVSATGLEFAYSQAPAAMKGAIMACWSLAVTIGNLWVLLLNAAVRNKSVIDLIGHTGLSVLGFQMFFFAGFAFVAAAVFGLYATRYTLVDHYRTGA